MRIDDRSDGTKLGFPREGDEIRNLLCRGAEAAEQLEIGGVLVRPTESSGLSKAGFNPLTRCLSHAKEVLRAACRESEWGTVGVETAKKILGSVAEEVARHAVLGGTVVGLSAAFLAGGGALTVGALGAIGYLTLPSLARWAGEQLTDSIHGWSSNVGGVLRRSLGSPGGVSN
ncbi:MAG: hypothetical protein RL417_1777 [Pseudomonadota bacterium]|jgi:hypothetical protein